ncbi:MAG: NAD(P)-binding protein, partial [Planctomycetaceae bacterium]|nr:NAD(P)-binding protein [Planctomycetaceae bacterium]
MGLAERKVCIIGGGVGGLTLALSLQQRGIPCRVFEKYDHFQHHRTGFLIWSYAIKILQTLDV